MLTLSSASRGLSAEIALQAALRCILRLGRPQEVFNLERAPILVQAVAGVMQAGLVITRMLCLPGRPSATSNNPTTIGQR